MKAKDLRERTVEDLRELAGVSRRELFERRMQNATGQLDDTSSIRRTRRVIARIEQAIHQRTLDAAGSKS